MDEDTFTNELQDLLNLLDVFSELDENVVYIDSVKSIEDATNKRLIVKLSDKSEFQLTIVRSKT